MSLLCLICVTAFPRVETLTLEECLEQAMENNPTLRGNKQKIAVAEARRGTYLDIPNTSIELSQNAIEGAGPDNGLTFSQEFDFPTVYVARRRVFKAEEDVLREEYGGVCAELRGNVVTLYNALQVAHVRMDFLQSEMNIYEEFSRITHRRFEEGDASRLECLNADRMKSKMGNRLEEAANTLKNLQFQLARAIGADGPVDASDWNLVVLEYAGADDFDALSTYSARALAARIELTRKNVWLARQQFLPGLSVSATSQLVIKGFNPYHVERQRFTKGNFMGFSVGITVPLFFGSKRSNLLSAKMETESARLELEDEMLRQKTEYDTLCNDLALLWERLSCYQNEAIGQATEIRKLAQISYELGEINYLEYMQNMESVAEIWLEYMDTIDRYNEITVKLQVLKGEI